MIKEEIYSQISDFNNDISDSKETKTNKYYYIQSDEALLKSKFIKEILKDETIKSKLDSIETIMDLCFGSGNLTTHILLENEINYNTIILNDYFLDDSNQELSELLENGELKQCNFFDTDCFEENSVDLLIFNPTHGGKPTTKDFVNKENKNFESLNSTLSRILKPNAIAIFRGWKDDFQELLFSNFKYKKMYLDGNQSLYVCYDIEIEKTEYYEYQDNEFILNEDCENTENDDIEDNSNISELMNSLDEVKIDNEINCLTSYKKIIPLVFSDKSKGKENWKNDFKYKNILFKGVPGTGKSRAIDKIIEKYLGIKDEKRNILRVNIHSASSNSDLMQGIGISSDDGNIKYSEKQGLILDIIKRATFHPNQPFVLILEEIQENSLNELIGDLIYLIEDDKREKLEADTKKYISYKSLVDELVENETVKNYVEIPYLVNDNTDYKKMIMPDNLFVFCTSNYRDDKKVIEDNLLRRFEVIEIYPSSDFDEFKEYAKEFFRELNESILKVMKENHEIHPDRYMIGHAIWKDVNDKDAFYKAFSKLITEFKDIKEIEFDIFKTVIKDLPFPESVDIEIKDNYYDIIKDIQIKIDYEFID